MGGCSSGMCGGSGSHISSGGGSYGSSCGDNGSNSNSFVLVVMVGNIIYYYFCDICSLIKC